MEEEAKKGSKLNFTTPVYLIICSSEEKERANSASHVIKPTLIIIYNNKNTIRTILSLVAREN